MSSTLWDVFISYASEDKNAVARPLAENLKKAGVRVWLDEHELKLGDSLSRKIDQGLALSRFGVVILSPSFFAKHWPRAELAGLRATEEDGQKRILPVWHNIDKAAIAKYSPIVADLLAIPTSAGLEKVSQAILDVIFSPDNGSPSVEEPTASRRRIELLSRKPTKDEFISFIRSYQRIIAHSMHSGFSPCWDVCIEGVKFDAVALANLGTTRVASLDCVLFLPIWENPFEYNLAATPSAVPILIDALANASKVLTEYELHEQTDEVSEIVQRLMEREDPRNSWNLGLKPMLQTTIFCGRRQFVDGTEASAQAWRNIRAGNPRCRLRTYDGLIEDFQDEGARGWNFHQAY